MPETTAPSPAAPADEPIRVRVSRPGQKDCQHLPPEHISDVLQQPGVIVSVDIQDPDDADVDLLREEFQFHQLALEDMVKGRQRPKVDEYPGYVFVVLYAPLPAQPGEQARTVEVDLFIGKNYVVAAHCGSVPAIEEAQTRWERTPPELRKDVGFLVHTLVDAIIDAYFPIVDSVEDRLDTLELNLYRATRGVNPEELLAVKRSLFTLRKAIYPLREVFNTFLRRDQELFSADTMPYFQDVYDHVLRLLDIIDVQRDMATGALDAHLAVISNRLNETMKALTVITICVAIVGAVFGMWGMNFDVIPLQHAHNGFWLISGGTCLLVVVALIWTRLRHYW